MNDRIKEHQDEFEALKALWNRVSNPPAGQSAEGIKVDSITAAIKAHAFFSRTDVYVITKDHIQYCSSVRFGGHCKNCKTKLPVGSKAWQVSAEHGGGLVCKKCGDALAGQLGFELFA